MPEKVVLASRSNQGWSKAAVFSATSADLDLKTRPSVLRQIDAPFLVFRAFFRSTSGGSADGKTATLDVLGWPTNISKAILLSRIALNAGNNSVNGDPTNFENTSDSYSWYEADTATYSSGIIRPEIRSYADGCGLIYVDALDCANISFRCNALSATTELLISMSSAGYVPPSVQVPFAATVSVSAAALTDNDFGLANAGSGREYLIRQMDVTLDASKGITIHTGASATGVIWGLHSLAQGFTSIPFAEPVRVGNGLKPLVTSSASFTGRVTLRGVTQPVEF